jgi:hypothetical protein
MKCVGFNAAAFCGSFFSFFFRGTLFFTCFALYGARCLWEKGTPSIMSIDRINKLLELRA